MRVLFVNPVEAGSGEIITSLHAARELAAGEHELVFFGTPLARRLLGDLQADFVALDEDPEVNLARWRRLLDDARPDAVVFADLPFFWLNYGIRKIGAPEELLTSLEGLDLPLYTFDHMGLAQEAKQIFFGPPHLAPTPNDVPEMPAHVRRLLPCPMHEPREVAGRRGRPFRYWDVPLGLDSERREEVRARYRERDDELLVLYPVPGWASRTAEDIGLPHYELLPEFLTLYLGELPRPLRLLVVNGDVIPDPPSERLRVTRLRTMPVDEFEALLFSVDLLLTDNGISIAMGKAICALQTCATLTNSKTLTQLIDELQGPLRQLMWCSEELSTGSIYPWRVYPSGTPEEIELLGIYRDNALVDCFTSVELFGADASAAQLAALLLDEDERAAQRARQRAYVDALTDLPTFGEILSEEREA